eukprot:COSAG01_NODE_30169_length_621_cov_1.212644_1_plen_195_part_01
MRFRPPQENAAASASAAASAAAAASAVAARAGESGLRAGWTRRYRVVACHSADTAAAPLPPLARRSDPTGTQCNRCGHTATARPAHATPPHHSAHSSPAAGPPPPPQPQTHHSTPHPHPFLRWRPRSAAERQREPPTPPPQRAAPATPAGSRCCHRRRLRRALWSDTYPGLPRRAAARAGCGRAHARQHSPAGTR